MAAEEQIAVEKQKAEILNERFQVTVASEAKLRDELDRLFARFNDQLDLQQRSQTAHANVIFDATERVAINSLQINGAMHEQVTKRTEAEAAVVQLERTLEQTSDHAAHELRSVQEQLHAAHEHADTLSTQAARLVEKEFLARRVAEHRAEQASWELETTASRWSEQSQLGELFATEMQTMAQVPSVPLCPPPSISLTPFVLQPRRSSPAAAASAGGVTVGPDLVGQWLDVHTAVDGARRGYVVVSPHSVVRFGPPDLLQ